MAVEAGKWILGALAGILVEKARETAEQHLQSGVESKQCSVVIIHKVNNRQNGFDIHFITQDGDDNRNYEALDDDSAYTGNIVQTDTTKESISSAAYLDRIEMNAHQTPTVVMIIILCGDQVIRGGGGVLIESKDMVDAAKRKDIVYATDSNNNAPGFCFNTVHSTHKTKALSIKSDAFNCEKNRTCLLDNIEIFGDKW